LSRLWLKPNPLPLCRPRAWSAPTLITEFTRLTLTGSPREN